MDLMASSEPASGVRTRAVMLPGGGDGDKKTGWWGVKKASPQKADTGDNNGAYRDVK